MILFVCHWGACLFYYLARCRSFESDTWVGTFAPNLPNQPVRRSVCSLVYLFLFSCSEALPSTASQYIKSLYWSITTLATVGYGDYTPVNDVEMAFVVSYMVFNVGLSAYLLGNMTTLATKADNATAAYRDKLSVCRQTSF